MTVGPWKRAGRVHWPWLVMIAVAGVVVWHAMNFADVADADFPKLIRPHFNTHPPAAYRLAEPGDTLDRVGLYLAAAALVLSLVSLVRLGWRRRQGLATSMGLWPAAVAIAAAGVWYSSTPGPTFDGWHGLGWRTLFNPRAPVATRSVLGVAAAVLALIVGRNLIGVWPDRGRLWAAANQARIVPLLWVAGVLVALRQVVIPGLEPAGYWPRCAFDLGLLAFGLAILRARPVGPGPASGKLRWGMGLGWVVVVLGGIMVTTYHRPLARLRAVVPGKIYISAMPTYRGLTIEQKRLGFKTIINLFDEASTQASPYHPGELRFIREHGLRYLGSPSDGLESDRFLDETLALARDPANWPILVHCHGCMDRSPAWMGIYRFLVEKQPLAAIYQEIERHRGTRPKAVVTLQYLRKLPRRAPEQFAADPTGAILERCAWGTADPFHLLDRNPARTNRRVVRRIDPDQPSRRP